jgi:hypothetical protein
MYVLSLTQNTWWHKCHLTLDATCYTSSVMSLSGHSIYSILTHMNKTGKLLSPLPLQSLLVFKDIIWGCTECLVVSCKVVVRLNCSMLQSVAPVPHDIQARAPVEL